jgi:translation initiation factor IF-2
MRVYELAKELGVDSKELISQAGGLDIEVKTASSGLSDEAVQLLRLAFAPEETTTAESSPAESSPAEPEAAELA